MASFLQNNGDIILDAVLTDYGRKLLAKGDGSFNVVKFAFADDEIDYGLFNPNTSTVLQDEKIMKTPILEAFTNNAASMKNVLMSMMPGVDNLLFLPILKLSNANDSSPGNFNNVYSGYVIPVNVSNVVNATPTTDALSGSGTTKYQTGILNVGSRNLIVVQGLDPSQTNSNQNLKDVYPALYETEYNIHVDNRFCSVGRNANGILTSLSPTSVDDDNQAIYKLTEQTLVNNISYVSPMSVTGNDIDTTIAGTKGSKVQFTIVPNGNLLFTNSMFDKYGKVLKLNSAQTSKDFRTIRTSIRIVGVNTGYSVEIPILFAKVV